MAESNDISGSRNHDSSASAPPAEPPEDSRLQTLQSGPANTRDPRSWAVWGALAGLVAGRMSYGEYTSIEAINGMLFAGVTFGAIVGFAAAKFLNARRVKDK